MAIFNEEYLFNEQSKKNDYIEEGMTLDEAFEVLDYFLETGGGARGKYVAMHQKQAEELEKKNNSIPETETREVTKKLPFGYKIQKDEKIDNRNLKRKLSSEQIDHEIKASKYSGQLEEEPGDKKHNGAIYLGHKDASYFIHNAGKPSKKFSWDTRKLEPDYQHGLNYRAMAKSAEGKEQFKKDFGGKSKPGIVQPHTYGIRQKKYSWESDEDFKKKQKQDAEDFKSDLKHRKAERDAAKAAHEQADMLAEACYTILEALGEFDED